MKEFDVALQIVKDRYRPLIDIQEEMVCLFDKNLNITYVNEAYCKHFKKQFSDILGTNILEFVPKAEHNNIIENLSKITPKRPLAKIIYQIKNGTRSGIWHEWKNTAVFNEKGEIVEFQAVGKDITELKKLREENVKLKSSQSVEHKTAPSFIGKQNGKKIIINAGEVSFIKANLISIEVFSPQKRAKVSMQIKEAEQLLKDMNFFRVHRSYLVNLDKIKSMESMNESKYKMYFYDIDDFVISSKRGAKELRRRLKS